MPVDVRVRHDRLLREQAVEMFERGCGYGLTARRLGVSAETVREWQKTYRVIGRVRLEMMSLSKRSWRITLALSSTLRAYAPRFCAVMLTVSRVLSAQLHHRLVSPDPCWDGSGVRLSPPHHTCGSLHDHPTHRQPVRQSQYPLSTTRPEDRRASATSWTPSRSISKSHRSRRPGRAATGRQ